MARTWNKDQLVTLCAVTTTGKPDVSKVLFTFPVPASAMKITQKVKRDEAKVKGRSGAVKKATGFEDAEIEITLKLLDDYGGTTALAKLKQFQAMYHDRSAPVTAAVKSAKKSKNPVPRVYAISCPQTDACGIKTVLFDGLDPDWPGNGTSSIQLSIHMTEYEPPIRSAEKFKGIDGSSDSGGFSSLTGMSSYVTEDEAQSENDALVAAGLSTWQVDERERLARLKAKTDAISGASNNTAYMQMGRSRMPKFGK